ncbi:short chain dehydrogenase [Niveomyces insectorum RCEF 264]|uniref:Short chain dehydrogenase n=1 Tax=Niveomyces insectorum RCEF 264 TaxID=1081102 RepID=A0A162J3Z0_9HYPO|nr:short chain dehydrogenase [Niveomyces insectorum RCEF 264]
MAPTTFRKLQDKHVLVIGGSAGIGLGVAEGALADGAWVTVASSTQARLDKAVNTLKAKYGTSAPVQGFLCNLTAMDVEARIDSLFKAATTASGAGPIDHVVFTAANSTAIGSLSDMTAESVLAGAQMRVVVPILLAKVAQRYLPKSNTSSLTFTAGQATENPPPGWALAVAYAGSVVTLTRALAVEMAPLRVNVVQPGLVRTDAWNMMPVEQREAFFAEVEKKLPVGAMGRPEDVAEAYLWLMKDRYVTGTSANSNGGALLI